MLEMWSWNWRSTVGVVAPLLAGWLAGSACATSSSARQQESTSETTAETEEASASDRVQSFETLDDLVEIVGQMPEADEPPGCEGRWREISESPFERGRVLYCEDFRGPERWKEASYLFAVDEDGRILGISVQAFFSNNAAAEGDFDEVSGELLGGCDSVAGGERRQVFACDGYHADVQWAPGRGTVEARYLFGVDAELFGFDA